MTVLLGGLVLLVFGPREDLAVLGGWRVLGFWLVQVGLSVGLLVTGLRLSMPAMAAPPSSIAFWMAGALLAHVVICAATLETSTLAPAAGHEWTSGLACFSAITVLSLAPLALGVVLLLRGLVTHLPSAFASVGLASGLAAEAAWRLHCAFSDWAHVLPSHSIAVLVPTCFAWIAAVRFRNST